MPSVGRDHTPLSGLGVPTITANAIPLIGVVWFNWEPETLVAVYTLELLVMFPLAGLKALFAGKPPRSDRENGIFDVSDSTLTEKRGSVTVHDRFPPIFPRNVPFGAAVISGGVWVGFFLLAPVADVVPVLDVLGQPAVLPTVAILTIGQVVEAGISYFQSGQYAEVSPYAVVEIPARQGLFLSIFLFVVTLGGATSVLVVFVVVKTLFEMSGVRVERGNGGRLAEWLSGPNSDTTAEPANVPEGQPSASFDVDQRSVVAAAVWRLLSKTGPFYVVLATFVWLGIPAFLGRGPPSLTLWIVSGLAGLVALGLMVVSDLVESVLTDAWMTYSRIGDHVVAHDRLTDEPQWVAAVGELRDPTVVGARPSDRYFGTRTLSVTTGWGVNETVRTLGPVSDPQELVEAFDLPIRSTDPSPLDRRFLRAAIGSGILILVGSVVAVTSSSVSWVGLVVSLPFLGAVPLGFWKLAHS